MLLKTRESYKRELLRMIALLLIGLKLHSQLQSLCYLLQTRNEPLAFPSCVYLYKRKASLLHKFWAAMNIFDLQAVESSIQL